MPPAITFPDVERAVVDYLTTALDSQATVSVGVPTDWTPAAELPHLEVALDGVPSFDARILARATIRLVARAATTTDAKALAAHAQGLLCAHPGGDGIAGVAPLTGVLPARDPDTRAELASVTCRVNVRGELIPQP